MSQYPTMPNFGVNAILTKEDSAHFKESKEDNTVGNKSEAGYTISRPRNKQKRRRLFDTAFTNLKDSQKQQLQEFEEDVGGTLLPFFYVHPQTHELILVQFKEPLSFVYKGNGLNKRWDVHGIKLREV
ncbi:hypothetical protein [Vreelandella sulfidaeris]|uniref:Uncharacterized protein n=1 Tax=Vreelandella sulfidaeris TaxID=115553 RepID=A0A455UEV7_9GAMM|nr:hypothetical protein HSBAA_29700 [Halomonas sulfidaeris]